MHFYEVTYSNNVKGLLKSKKPIYNVKQVDPTCKEVKILTLFQYLTSFIKYQIILK